MEQEICKKCGCIQLAHTGKAGTITVGFGMAVHADYGYCIACANKQTPCFGFEGK